MSFDLLLLAGVVVGLAIVGLAIFAGRRDRAATGSAGPDGESSADPASVEASDDPLARLTETVATLQRLAALKEEEIQRDNEARDEIRVDWRPTSDTAEESEMAAAPLPPIVREVEQIRFNPSTKIHTDSVAKLKLSVGQAFSPAAPISRRDLFAGRQQQLEMLIDVVFERGQHAIVYGERGVGKTSLAVIAALVLAEEGTRLPLRVNCDSGDTYDAVWRKVIEEFEVAIGTWSAGLPQSRAAIARALAKDEITPNDVARFLKEVAPEVECVVLIDEFDTLTDEKAPRLFADTIKTLSDQLVTSTLILVGVADSLDELLAEHASIHRALIHVHMPRMSSDELKEIVTRGLELLTMDIEDDATDLIALLSQGFPHFTHQLAQAAARAAIDDQRPLVTVGDVEAATATVSGRIESWIQDAYDKATASLDDATHVQILLASALAPTDERGYFAASDVRDPLASIAGKSAPSGLTKQLNALAAPDQSPVLIRTGTGNKHRYRFSEPQMEAYVIIRSMGDGLIDRESLGRLVAAAAAP